MRTVLTDLFNRRKFVYCVIFCGIFIVIARVLLPYDRIRKFKFPLSFTFSERYYHLRNATYVPFCKGLLDNNDTSIKQAKEYMSQRSEPHGKLETHFQNGTFDCVRFREERGYFTRPLSEEEAQFPIAYSILIYKDIEQVERLLRAIYMPQNHYCIHVDIKSKEDVQNRIRTISNCFPNMFIASKLEDVRWGEFSVVQAELNCLKDLLRYKGWRYFINLTGQEFPLVSNRQLVKDLIILNNTNLIGSYLDSKPQSIARTKYKWIGSKRTDILKGQPPHNITIAKGSTHVILSRDFVDYVINNEVSRHFLSWLNDTWCPDETFFASLQYSKHLGAPGSHSGSRLGPVHFSIRHKIWRGGTNVCAGKWVRDICVSGVGDLHRIASGAGLFLNKLYLDFEPLTLDCLEEYHRNLTLGIQDISSTTTLAMLTSS